MKQIKLLVCTILVASIFFWGCLFAEEPTVHTIYLPAIHSGPKPAMLGVCGFAGFDKIGAEWAYSWTGNTGSNPRFVPMIRDIRPETMSRLSEAVENARASGWLMGFNEPDMEWPYGWLTTPEEGARAWRLIEEAALGIKLLSPTPSQNDFDWLWRMVTAYESLYGERPRFDAIGVHYYSGCPPDIEAGKQHLLRVRQEALVHGYDVPLWLTEFAGCCPLPDPENGNAQMMIELIPWMKARAWMGRYAWFMALIQPDDPVLPGFTSCSLIHWETGELTELGKLYGSFR